MRKMFAVLPSVTASALLMAFLLVPALFAFAFTKDEAAKGGITHPQRLVAFVLALQKAVREGNKAAVANAMEYPLRLPLEKGGEVDIHKAKDFLRHYDKIMTKTMRDNLLELSPEDILFRHAGALLACDDARQLWAVERGTKVMTYIKGM